MKKRLRIRVGYLKIVDHLILGVSLSRLPPHGLDLSILETIPMNSWHQIQEGLIQGELQGAFIPVPLAMDLFAAGLNLSFLMFVHRSGSTLFTNQKLAIKQLSELRGKTILIPHELSVQHMLVHKLLASAGLALSLPGKINDPRVDRVLPDNQVRAESVNPMLMPQMVEMDEDQEIGGCIGSEPYGALVSGVAARLCSSHSLWKDHPGCGFVVHSDLASSHGDALEELVVHLFQSARLLTRPNPERIIHWAEDFLGQPSPIVRQALFTDGLSFDPEKLVPDREKLDIIQNYMSGAMGIMSQTIDVNVFVDPLFAHRALGKTGQ